MNATSDASRRGFLRSACRHCLGLGALAGLPALAQDLKSGVLPPRFARPAKDTDEGGLWGLMDREETRIKRSPLVIRDQALTTYLADLVCKLTDGHCPDIRVHALRMPHFNATMAPNGMMVVWTGLLLRAENEAQLAAILGHELGHYLERHTVEQLRAAKDRAVLAQLAGLVGGIGGVVGQVGLMANAFAFSREHESRADRLGMRLMQQAGYDGRQAALVWDNLLAEMKVTGGADAGKNNDLLATHPATSERRDELLTLAGARGGEQGEERYRKTMAPLRFGWLQDEIKRGQYEESLILFDRMLKRDAADAEVLYARGETYRVRDESGDSARAVTDLRAASEAKGAPAVAFRSLGLVHKQRNENGAALQAFQQYLALAPQAGDAGLVRSYLTELKP
ncbi:M48 family metalloprotease [Caenimonas sedimenti]|uniref:M48 family metalloprotease n=1 Tax=Caenimonas sedimenti TaxID=2596921 RepID=A0A562ZUA9_9BURK|nr:M48 family metalloprotease [Caenimonas sedimenti]TWO71946.1 M48 family metalloprotease [Caenimonas sedimenti]